MSDEDNERLVLLEAAEKALSARRTRLHEGIDSARQTAGTDRAAAARFDALLADERRLGDARRALHARIDELVTSRRQAR